MPSITSYSHFHLIIVLWYGSSFLKFHLPNFASTKKKAKHFIYHGRMEKVDFATACTRLAVAVSDESYQLSSV